MSSKTYITQKAFQKMGVEFDYYIRESDTRLRTDENIIIHLDGVDFTHKYYRQLSADTKKAVVKALVTASQKICESVSSVGIAYCFSDEVSFVLLGKDIDANEHNRIGKLLSKFASLLTLYFHLELEKMGKKELAELMKNGIFSAKIFNLPKAMVDSYLKWRQQACQKLICDRKENPMEKSNEERFGYLIKMQDAKWQEVSVDFSNVKFTMNPQGPYINITKTEGKK